MTKVGGKVVVKAASDFFRQTMLSLNKCKKYLEKRGIDKFGKKEGSTFFYQSIYFKINFNKLNIKNLFFYKFLQLFENYSSKIEPGFSNNLEKLLFLNYDYLKL